MSTKIESEEQLVGMLAGGCTTMMRAAAEAMETQLDGEQVTDALNKTWDALDDADEWDADNMVMLAALLLASAAINLDVTASPDDGAIDADSESK